MCESRFPFLPEFYLKQKNFSALDGTQIQTSVARIATAQSNVMSTISRQSNLQCQFYTKT